MSDRIHSVDATRIVAIVFVVIIHTNPFEGVGTYGNAFNFSLETTARFAVPFFFAASGYFFALGTARRDLTASLVDRVTGLVSLYVYGIVLASPVFLTATVLPADSGGRDIVSSAIPKLVEFGSPLELIYYGTSVSEILWFLPALVFSYLLIALCLESGLGDYVLPISLGFHLVGLMGSGYTMFVDIPFEIRDALFFGFFYVSLGYTIYSRDWQPSPERSTLYLGATVLFGALHLGERYVLGYVLTAETIGQGVYGPSYTIATALGTVSLFCFLLSRPDLGRSTALPSWGRTYAVGIYVAHPPVLFVLEKASETFTSFGYDVLNTILWHLVSTPATVLGALIVYLASRKLRAIAADGNGLPRSERIRNLGSK